MEAEPIVAHRRDAEVIVVASAVISGRWGATSNYCGGDSAHYNAFVKSRLLRERYLEAPSALESDTTRDDYRPTSSRKNCASENLRPEPFLTTTRFIDGIT
jgi:hypothetical protein